MFVHMCVNVHVCAHVCVCVCRSVTIAQPGADPTLVPMMSMIREIRWLSFRAMFVCMFVHMCICVCKPVTSAQTVANLTLQQEHALYTINKRI